MCLLARRSRSRLRLFTSLNRICRWNSAIGFPHLNLTVLYPSLQTRLRMHGGTINHMTISNGEARAVPRTLDDVAVKLAFRERTAEVRACFSKGVYLRATAD